MKKINTFILVGIITMIACVEKNETATDESGSDDKIKAVSFFTKDSIRVFGDLYESEKNEMLILLFHQGGSNARGEYHSIVPVLTREGYNVLTIDQRQGGQVYGSYNRTVADISDHDYGYCDAYPDLEGALKFALHSGFSGKKVLWGSSYSASLAIRLASENQNEVSGVLAFSPASGGPMQECRPDEYFDSLKIPLLVLRPASEMEIPSAQQQFELVEKSGHQTYVATHGVHGSSMLVDKRIDHDAGENWKVVLSFLEKVGSKE